MEKLKSFLRWLAIILLATAFLLGICAVASMTLNVPCDPAPGSPGYWQSDNRC